MKINLLKKAKRLSKFILNDLESKLLLKEEIDPKLKESLIGMKRLQSKI